MGALLVKRSNDGLISLGNTLHFLGNCKQLGPGEKLLQRNA